MKFQRDIRGRAATALPAILFCLVSGLPAPGQTTPTTPTRTIIPVQFNGTNSDITIGATTYSGKGGNTFHVVAISRQPDYTQLDAPDIIWDRNYQNPDAVNNDLTSLRTTNPDAMILVNASGNYGFVLWQVGVALTGFGATTEVGAQNTIPFVFAGISGLTVGTAPLQRAYVTPAQQAYNRPVNGYLAPDSNGNYAFVQMEFIRYDITTDGTIRIGSKTYPIAKAPYRPGCDAAGSNGFHLVVVDREVPEGPALADNAYCGGDYRSMANDISGIKDEGQLVFIATNGTPAPSDWNFSGEGDIRFYALAEEVRRLGGFFETVVHLKPGSPGDAYSLVGAALPPPPTVLKGGNKRARESSSVYPEMRAGRRPTGELHGVLARSGRGNFFSPFNADTSGLANFGLYQALGATPAPFPVPSTPSELTAYQSITSKLCGANCNIRDAYDDLNISLTNYQIQLQTMMDPSGKNCDVSGSGADPNFCRVRSQLLIELTYVSDIRSLYTNLQSLWLGSGSINILAQLSTYNTIKAQLQTPDTATSQSLVSPLVNFFLGLASFIPEVGPAFGLADVAFNLATGLTTDPQGNKQIDLTSTIGNLQQQAIDQFTAQQTTTGTLFQLIYQDWGKLSTLGSAIATQTSPSSPWYWGFNTTGLLLNQMTPAIRRAAYQNLMAAAYTIGSFVPPQFNQLPLSAPSQLQSYRVGTSRSCGCVPFETPFSSYIPYTYPGDTGNPSADDPSTSTILSDSAWLAISQSNTPWNSNYDAYQYIPPSADIRTLLFNPVWKGGLGIYRPDFFNNWPFPRVQCDLSMGDYNGYSHSGGCNWSAGAPAPEQLAPSARSPLTRLTIRAKQASLDRPRKPEVQVHLMVHNNGTANTRAIGIHSITVQTLGPGGPTTLLGPAVPVQIPHLRPGKVAHVFLRLHVPLGVSRISITEHGTMTSGVGRAPSTFHFSEAQSLILR